MRAAAGSALAVAAVALAACESPQNMLSPDSRPAREIATLWWWMLIVATVVFAGTVGWIVLSYLLRDRRGLPFVGDSERANRGLVLVFGIAIPIVALIATFVVANLVLIERTDASPDRGGEPLRIEVTGNQWWWEIRYPEREGAITANEFHIPVGRRVQVRVRTDDVIHSFWIPELNRKIDLLPGEDNTVELFAERPGRYEGSCSEYCGLQHAHMRLAAIAEEPAAFEAYLDGIAAPASAPGSEQARQGRQLFEANACADCHRIRGTSARGAVGPDLTHVASRDTLAALLVDNTPQELLEWISEPQHVKPGNRMPELTLTPDQFRAIAAYLEDLE